MRIVALSDSGEIFDLPAREEVGEWIKTNRLRTNLSLQQIAEAVGVTRQAVWTWERGKSIPQAHHMAGMAELFYGPVRMELSGTASTSDGSVLGDVEKILGC